MQREIIRIDLVDNGIVVHSETGVYPETNYYETRTVALKAVALSLGLDIELKINGVSMHHCITEHFEKVRNKKHISE